MSDKRLVVLFACDTTAFEKGATRMSLSMDLSILRRCIETGTWSDDPDENDRERQHFLAALERLEAALEQKLGEE